MEGITDFTVCFDVNGKNYSFNASAIKRDVADGEGKPVLGAVVYDKDGRRGVCNLSPDWRIISLFME